MEIWQVVLVTLLGSSGMWSFLTMYMQKRAEKRAKKTETNTATSRMLLGLGHDRIYYLCEKYIDRWQKKHIGVTSDEYDNLVKYLYEPYKEMNGNGTADRLIEDFKKIPIQAARLSELKITNVDGAEVPNPMR